MSAIRFGSIFLLIVLFCSCGPVRLIAPYDSITDQKITSLHEDVSAHLINLERELDVNETAVYKDAKFYDNARVDIEVLKARVAAIDNNDIVIKQVMEIDNMIDQLEDLHKLGFSEKIQVVALQQPFTSAFTALIKLQMALNSREN